jgi:hypothetical protein
VKSLLAAGVIALTLAAVPSTALADEPAPAPVAAPATSTSPATETGTPLVTRPSKPLALAPANPSSPIGYKVLAGFGLAAAAAMWLRSKRKTAPSAKARSSIDVVGRTSVGVRSELLVVDVEGTRLLVGMTPSAISTLAVLETPDDDVAPAALASKFDDAVVLPMESLAPEPLVQLGERVRALFEAPSAQLDDKPPPAKPLRGTQAKGVGLGEPKRARRSPVPKAPRAAVAGQAKGLLLALEEPTSKSGP